MALIESRRDPFQAAADLIDPPIVGAAVYRNDPVGFVRDCIRWESGQGPTEYQCENMRLLVERRRLAIRAPHSAGKSTTNAWLVLWFALTRDAFGIDWKVITTASAWRQLDKFLWPEIRKWAPKLDWEKIGRKPFNQRELMKISLQLRTGEAFAAACENPAKIEGAHADHLLFIFDEAKSIPASTFDACEGALGGAAKGTHNEAYAITSSTPGPPEGRFYEIHQRKTGLEDWATRHVKKDDVVASGRLDADWADMRMRQWGVTSPLYRNRVLGEFAESTLDGVIFLSWVEAAIERWRKWKDDEHDLSPDSENSLSAIGVDVGGDAGGDLTVISLRYGNVISELRCLPLKDPMEIAGVVLGICEANHHPAKRISVIVDAIGIGAGVVARLKETSKELIVPFVASVKTDRRDRTREIGFLNSRAAAWWNLREMLDPSAGASLCLPADDDMTAELIAVQWKESSNARIQIELKQDIRRRCGWSTDRADSIIHACWPETGMVVHAPMFARSPSASRWTIS